MLFFVSNNIFFPALRSASENHCYKQFHCLVFHPANRKTVVIYELNFDPNLFVMCDVSSTINSNVFGCVSAGILIELGTKQITKNTVFVIIFSIGDWSESKIYDSDSYFFGLMFATFFYDSLFLCSLHSTNNVDMLYFFYIFIFAWRTFCELRNFFRPIPGHNMNGK